MKKLVILLLVAILVIVAIIFIPIVAALPWFTTTSGQPTPMEEGSVSTAITTLPPLPTMTTKPGTPTASPTSTSDQLSSVPLCFSPIDINAFAFTPDGSSLLVQGPNGVQIFNLITQKEVIFLQAPRNIVTAALSPDGKILAWSLDDNTIQLVQVSDQTVLHTIPALPDMVTKLRFTPDASILVSASHDYKVRFWTLEGNKLLTIEPVDGLGIGISPDGSMLATVPSDGPVAIYSLDSGEKIKELGGFGGYDTSDPEFSRDGKYLAADLASGLFMWRISDGSLVWDAVKNSMAFAFSPDGKYLAYSNIDDGNKVTLAFPDAKQVFRVFDRMLAPVWSAFFSPDSSLLAAVDGQEIHIWRVEDGKLLYVGKRSCP